MEKHFILLGGHRLAKGTYNVLSSLGYKVIVIDWNENPGTKGDIHHRIDVKDTKAVLKCLKKENYNVCGAITFIDLAVPTLIEIHKTYGLCHLPDDFNKVLTKSRMTDTWQKAGLLNRFSGKFDKETDLNLIKNINSKYSVIIKPNVCSSSRGITIIDKGSSIPTIKDAFDKAQQKSYDNNVVVEEFIEGREFTVEMLGDNFGNVSVYAISVKYHSSNAGKNKVAVKLHYNSKAYPDSTFDKIAEYGKKCYKSLGLKNSFGHLEIILKKDETLSPVEIGARSSGYIASHLVSASSGRNFIKDYIEIINGGKISGKDYINGNYSSMWFGYDIPSGKTSKKYSDLSKFLDKNIEIMAYNRDGIKADTYYPGISDDDGRDSHGFEMLKGKRSILTIENIKKAETAFLKDFLL